MQASFASRILKLVFYNGCYSWTSCHKLMNLMDLVVVIHHCFGNEGANDVTFVTQVSPRL
jgi:hypothetical protein